MKHFSKSEFRCPDGCGLDFNYIDEDALCMLQKARAKAGVPFHITSSIRCPVHNREVGGSVTSSHLSGVAFDIACTHSYPRFIIIEALLAAGFNRVGIRHDFIHCDVDLDKAKELIWVY